ELAPHLFARIGDIYFHLNNYELAEDFYALSLKIAKDKNVIQREELILRAEALFWIGKFAESFELFDFSISGHAMVDDKKVLPSDFNAYANLRKADIHMAKKEYDEARLHYYQVKSYFPHSDAFHVAAVRLACLDLPYFKGNNVHHARNYLTTA